MKFADELRQKAKENYQSPSEKTETTKCIYEKFVEKAALEEVKYIKDSCMQAAAEGKFSKEIHLLFQPDLEMRRRGLRVWDVYPYIDYNLASLGKSYSRVCADFRRKVTSLLQEEGIRISSLKIESEWFDGDNDFMSRFVIKVEW